MAQLEQLRVAHEQVEIFERAIFNHIAKRPKTHTKMVMHENALDRLLQAGKRSAGRVLSLAADKDGMLKEERDAMTGPDSLSHFYDRLKQVREYHRRHPEATAPNLAGEVQDAYAAAPPLFSGEEHTGRFLDLLEHHDAYRNLAMAEPLDYKAYLEHLPGFDKVPVARKDQAYRRYVASLAAYLRLFLKRVRPLEVVDDQAQLDRFTAAWQADAVAGWEGKGGAKGRGGGDGSSSSSTSGASSSSAAAGAGAGAGAARIDLAGYGTAEELEGLGMQALKEQLMARGMKCGGSLADRAGRLMSVKGVADADIPAKLRAKAPKKKKGSGGAASAAAAPAASAAAASAAASTVAAAGGSGAAGSSSDALAGVPWTLTGHKRGRDIGARECAMNEWVVAWLLGDKLRETLAATVRQVEKKQTRTFEELEAELAEEEREAGEGGDGDGGAAGDGGDDDDDDDDDEPGMDAEALYNPKNLPLDWTGKPIAYWLYKLHGLNMEFKCEICGNHTYRGPRNFNRHFQSSRHAHGMRCLKIPNTKHFHGITVIEDAIALYGRIKDELKETEWDASTQEEFEDSEGNVLSKKTYEDLARQGLL